MKSLQSGSGDELLEAMSALLSRIPQVKFAYVFGSLARGDTGPLSDIDVAVFLDYRVSFFVWRLRLIEELARVLKTERFDLVTLNDASPLLKYEVIREGRVIKENKKRRVEFETRTLGEYLDTAFLRQVQRAYLKEQLTRGDCHGQ
jgi:predicted nucleotidyltransferase